MTDAQADGRTPHIGPDGAGLLVLRNRRAGASTLRADRGARLLRELPAARVRELEPDEDMADVVAEAVAGVDPPRMLGVLGGDGSVSAMAHIARTVDLPLWVVPGGTFNHFSRALGIVGPDAAIAALRGGRVRAIDVLEVRVDDGEPQTVLNAASLGLYAGLIDERERRQSLGKWLGALVAASDEITEAQPTEIVVDGRRARVWSVFIGVGLHASDQVAALQRSEADAGTLDIRIHHARGGRLRALASLAFGRRTRAVLRAVRVFPPARDVERRLVDALELRVRPVDADQAAWVHDGELEKAPESGFTLHLRRVPAALSVVTS